MRDVLDHVANPVLHVRGEQRGHRAGGEGSLGAPAKCAPEVGS